MKTMSRITLQSIYELLETVAGQVSVNTFDLQGIKAELVEVRTDLARKADKTEIDDFKTELKLEISGLRSELHSEISGLRSEFKAEVGGIRSDMCELRSELKESINQNDTVY